MPSRGTRGFIQGRSLTCVASATVPSRTSPLYADTMTHDQNTPWKNYLVVLKDNMEVKTEKPRCPGRKVKVEIVVVGKGESGVGGRLQEGAMLVHSEPFTLSANWGDPGTSTLVSHTTLVGSRSSRQRCRQGPTYPLSPQTGPMSSLWMDPLSLSPSPCPPSLFPHRPPVPSLSRLCLSLSLSLSQGPCLPQFLFQRPLLF